MSTHLGRWLAFAAMMTVAGVLQGLGLVPLLGWIERPAGDGDVPGLIALLVIAHGALLAAPARHRGAVLATSSIACSLLVSVPFTAFGVAWALLFRALLCSRLQPRVTVLFPIATLVALVVLADASRAPTWVVTHPWTSVMCALFAFGWFLRALVVWHEARLGRLPTALEAVGYFFFAPYTLVPPYMLALPRLALVGEGVTRLDAKVQRSGLRWLAYGLALQAIVVALQRLGLDPLPRLHDALRAGEWWYAVPLALAVYPGAAVVTGCAAGALLVGLTRSFGVAMAPAFDAPLLSRSVADWWRRYNTQFRGLLVDLFWYRIALRYRRRPVVAGYLGCAAVFLLGSVPLHWVRPAAIHGTLRSFPWNIAAECVVMTVLVGTSLALERLQTARRAARPASSARVWSQRFTTWCAICAVTYALGYGVQYAVRVAHWERLAARVQTAATPADGAALVPGLAGVVAERPREPARRAALAQALAIAGAHDRARRELAIAAAFASYPTAADLFALARARAVLDDPTHCLPPGATDDRNRAVR